MKKTSFIFLLALSAACCAPEKSPIEYGLDKCHYCRMTIVDQRFGAELVTPKGKVYKFDATECLAHYIHQEDLNSSETALLFTNTWDRPGELIPVNECYFLQSKNMPSPMGEYINPFSDQALALENRESNSGNIYRWDDLKEKFGNNFGSR
jgi:copper chaperone NosL